MEGKREVVINMDGEAICGLCGKIIWRVPNRDDWIKSGRHAAHQTLLMTSHLNHLEKEHRGEW